MAADPVELHFESSQIRVSKGFVLTHQNKLREDIRLIMRPGYTTQRKQVPWLENRLGCWSDFSARILGYCIQKFFNRCNEYALCVCLVPRSGPEGHN